MQIKFCVNGTDLRYNSLNTRKWFKKKLFFDLQIVVEHIDIYLFTGKVHNCIVGSYYLVLLLQVEILIKQYRIQGFYRMVIVR